MNSISKHIITTGLCIGSVSLLSFAGVIIPLPFIVVALLVLLSFWGIYKWTKHNVAQNERNSLLFIGILLIGLTLLSSHCLNVAQKYGDWDAWYIWDLHARYLFDHNTWQNLFKNQDGTHPDYPMALPSILLFFKKLIADKNSWVMNFGFHYLVMILIPVLIFAETYKKTIFFSTLAFLLMATNDFYITEAISQFADTLIAFFFLAAIVSIDNYENNPKMVIISAAFLGLCMWTKNEGIILTLFFTLFHINILAKKRNIGLFAAGIALPAIVLLIFKMRYAPANDMLSQQSIHSYDLLFDTERYQMIFSSFTDNYVQYFRDVRYGIAIYVLMIVIRRQWPDKQILMVTSIALVYMLIYVITPHQLKWHLFTSQKRLMHQLMPAMIFLLVKAFGGKNHTNYFRVRYFSTRQRQV